MAKNDGEPPLAPQPERWYELKLGSSFKDRPSSKFCTLRYEFKPASIDKSQRGMLHKNKDNRVTVEFNNNQPGKPKVVFEGTSEDYKDNDSVMFFGGESFRLERLHRAVKRLRHVRLPGESAATFNITSAVTNAPAVESRSPPLVKTVKPQILNKPAHPAMCLEVERIDIGDAESSGAKKPKISSDMHHPTLPNNFSASPDAKSHGPDDDNVDILEEDDDGDRSPLKPDRLVLDMNLPNPNNDGTDDEIADVDASDDESNKGPNAAEALRAQVTAAEEGQLQGRQHGDETSSSSGSGSASGSSGSGSASGTSSSSDSDDSDRADSASSGGDVDI